MANVTDPLARSVHGTNPQNLIEYITRQKIYDSQYWKEECFGLSASDVATKATQLQAIGGSYGGNNKPTRFLCLALKMLQIQPEEGIVEEFLQNEDFKYVRALGAFYLRLTGRPAEIYELMEPLYNDFRKLRFREPTGWKITHVDELADELLTSDRYCGIALPHLPKRDVLVSAGHLDGPRRSALMPLIEEQCGGDTDKFLKILADNGNVGAQVAVDERRQRKKDAQEKDIQFQKLQENVMKTKDGCNSDKYYSDKVQNLDSITYNRRRDNKYRYSGEQRERESHHQDYCNERINETREYLHHNDCSTQQPHHPSKSSSSHHSIRVSSNKEKKYGSLFKKSSRVDSSDDQRISPSDRRQHTSNVTREVVIEGSEEYWNEQRAKLGLKPLKNG